jgi:GNAT superfamily N-acetyltransferase
MIKLIRCNSVNKDFRDLVILLDEDLNSRYGILQAQYKKFNKIEANETVMVAYQDKIPVGCGCFKKFDTSSVEIKRMFVKKENRGKGIAKRILTELERWAEENGNKTTFLETGIKQHEAISFYTNFGYKRIENFGQYIGNTNSICMSKVLNSK